MSGDKWRWTKDCDGDCGSTTLRQTKDGNWVKAEPIPYYPNVFERVWLWIKALREAPKGE